MPLLDLSKFHFSFPVSISSNKSTAQMAQGSHHRLHFLLVPFMAPGHLIPMADIARLLAEQDVLVTIVTTPVNTNRIKPIIDKAVESGLGIQLCQIEIPVLEAGLPEGCESMELVPSRPLIRNFFCALDKLQQPLEQLIEQLEPIPACILADKYHAWIENIASKFQIPRLLFDGTSCFNLMCLHHILKSKVYENVHESQSFVVPNLPHRIELTAAQLPGDLNPNTREFKDIHQKIRTCEEGAYGVVVNSFEELESDYVKEFQKTERGKVYCIGPVSLSHKVTSDSIHRGSKTMIDEKLCMKWLDTWPSKSVLYVCLGSLGRISLSQMKELALALEASKCPFIWVMREDNTGETEKWMIEDGFKERAKERGLVIMGWAPQLLILSHPSIGGFLTHCGWNSTLEAICGGVPMITWPMFADQFYNDKLVVQILDIGERVGVEISVPIGSQDKFGALVKRENITEAIDKVMGEGKEKEERRERGRKLANLAKRAMQVGGSSNMNLKMLLEDIARLSPRSQPSNEICVCAFEDLKHSRLTLQ